MNFFLSLIFFLGLVSFAFSQSKIIKGQVLLSEHLRSAEDIYIKNLNSNKFAVTDITGKFQINAEINDTIQFYGEFLKDRKIIITQEHIEQNYLYVALENEVIELDELIANPFITGNLKADLEKIKYIDTISVLYANLGLNIKNRDINPREKRESVLPSIGNIPIPTSLNVETLYKLITGYYKKQERFRDYESLDKTTKELLKIIPENYFLKALKIPEEEIFNFALFAVQTDKSLFTNLLNDSNYAEVKIILENKAKIYLKRLNATEKDS